MRYILSMSIVTTRYIDVYESISICNTGSANNTTIKRIQHQVDHNRNLHEIPHMIYLPRAPYTCSESLTGDKTSWPCT